ncbi:methyltransferase domain-containing protein [Halochromatium glycolicum]|uniref:SAM-dependent methyltransferase n=1 Tax=Halochromatium glycolicum TaxID=85075 RepID=A0AAJ0X907_9GAMM|nr:SAM-dependent methyltransferase [Halochromatium glycolicum]
MTNFRCKFCDTKLEHTFVDLGLGPLVDAYVDADALDRMEPFFPLHAYVCHQCFLVQLPPAVRPDEMFIDYPYFSSVSTSWLEHARRYADEAIKQFGLGSTSRVKEIASNDGYLLQYFHAAGIPVLGIEPAANVAEIANAKGIPTVSRFFGLTTAEEVRTEHGAADLLIGNNVLAHVPERNDFIAGLKHLLAEDGVLTMEFPHLLRTMQENQFDQVFHEHFSYLSLVTVERMFSAHGLALFDVAELPTHGGSLRIYARHAERSEPAATPRLDALRAREQRFGLEDVVTYANFAERPKQVKHGLLTFLLKAKHEGKSVVGYGAAGKAAVLLNFCGIGVDFLDFIADLSPHKQGKYMPGVRIPIEPPEAIDKAKPDYVLILSWNLKDEIMQQLSHIRDWGGQFVLPIPETRIC